MGSKDGVEDASKTQILKVQTSDQIKIRIDKFK